MESDTSPVALAALIALIGAALGYWVAVFGLHGGCGGFDGGPEPGQEWICGAPLDLLGVAAILGPLLLAALAVARDDRRWLAGAVLLPLGCLLIGGAAIELTGSFG